MYHASQSKDCDDKYLPPIRRKKRAFFHALEPGTKVSVFLSPRGEGALASKGVVVKAAVYPNTWLSVKIGSKIVKVRTSCIELAADDAQEGCLPHQAIMPITSHMMGFQPDSSPLRPVEHPSEPLEGALSIGACGDTFSYSSQLIGGDGHASRPSQLTHVC